MPSLASPAERSTRTRAMLALGVAGVWLFAALPFLTGTAACPSATLFHRPCPGCGMTRALLMMAHGDVAGSLSMHPLALPAALAQIALAAATVAATFQRGTPFAVLATRYGRASVIATGVVLLLAVLLWIARAFGAFGGPVYV